MIKFFRKIRKNLLYGSSTDRKTGKLTRYLLYAIGEIILVVIGILIALSINNWNQNQNEIKIARQNLEAFKNDLVQHEKIYTKQILGAKREIPLYDSIVSIFYAKNENAELSVLSRLLLEGQRNIVITINTPTYDQLINSGNLRFIDNKNLKDSITNYKNNIDFLLNYNNRIINTLNNQSGELGKIIDVHDFWNIKKNIIGYTPEMNPFTLLPEQRKFIVAHYKMYTVEILSISILIKTLSNSNKELIKMIDKELSR